MAARVCARDGSVRCVRQIIRVIRHMLRERRWWHLPRYTFGSSSGGVIALELPLRFPFQARWGSPGVGVHACEDRALCGRMMSAVCFPGAGSGEAAYCWVRVLRVCPSLS